MGTPANVRSIHAIRRFRADLRAYEEGLGQTLEMLSAELKRAVEYLESDRAAYWPAQVRKASDRVVEARNRLERCEIATATGEGPSCYEEKKALRRAKQRLREAEQKVKATRKWARVVKQEVDEFQTRLAQLRHLAERDLPHGSALLDRWVQRLERYASPRSGSVQSVSAPTDRAGK